MTLINDRRIEFVTIARELDIVIINDVEFTAPCPVCGMDTTWYQFRESTHVVSMVNCVVCEVRNGSKA